MKEKLLKIREDIGTYKRVAIAFSGGVDSTLLSKVSYNLLKKEAIAITIVGDMHSKAEIQEGRELARGIGIPHVEIDIRGREIPRFSENQKDRCYHCKKYIFTLIQDKARELGIEVILDGSNVDDLSDFRPGMKALKELGIVSPLKDAGFTKSDIRKISREFGLPTWDKPAFACLASRIPYDIKITREKLDMIEMGEAYLKEIGIKQYRVRHHGEVARIEIEDGELEKILDRETFAMISKRFSEIGFKYTALDLAGYKQGSMNL